MGDENIAIKCDRDWLKGQLDLLRAKLAAAEKERDEAMSKLNRTTTRLYAQIDSIEAKHAEAMRALATRNANELNAAQRSYRAQIGELTRALTEEKEAHNDALGFAQDHLSYFPRSIYTIPRAEVLAAMLEVCAAAQEWHAVDRELDPLNAARATARLLRAVRAMEASRG